MEDFGAFLDGGVTAVDTADIYGPSERLIGDYVRSAGDKAAQMKARRSSISAWTRAPFLVTDLMIHHLGRCRDRGFPQPSLSC